MSGIHTCYSTASSTALPGSVQALRFCSRSVNRRGNRLAVGFLVMRARAAVLMHVTHHDRVYDTAEAGRARESKSRRWMEQIVNSRVPMQFWKTPAAAVALVLMTLAIGARAWNCASATSCSAISDAICSPCCESPSCARVVEGVKESSPRLDRALDVEAVAVMRARPTAPRQIGTTHARVAHAPPLVSDRLALLSILLI